MRVLFTSDLHALPEAYQGFSTALRSFDVGVIAGDLLDDYVAYEKLMKMFDLSPDDFLEELPDPDATIDDRLDAWRNSPQHAHLVRGLEEREHEIKEVLRKANKPVLVVRGNHDTSPLSSEGNFHNIHMKRLDLDGIPFVGYGWFGRELNPERQMDRFGEVEPLIDRNTILVTHCPPYAVLDVAGRGGLNNSIGSAELGKAIQRTRPRFHLFGHAHASAGIVGNSVNGAYPSVSHFFGIDTATGEVWVEKDKTRPRPIWVQEVEDSGDAEELVDLETIERNQMREERRKDMRLNGTWYHDGGEIAGGRLGQ